jgi:hypothetical protein
VDQFGFGQHAPPGISDLDLSSRIVRFFCRRHNDFAHQTSVSTNDTNDRRTLNSGHVSGTNQRRVELV